MFYIGLGFASVMVSLLISIYYNVIICVCIFFFFKSMTSQLPWETCDNPWNNNETCRTLEDLKRIRNLTLHSKCLYIHVYMYMYMYMCIEAACKYSTHSSCGQQCLFILRRNLNTVHVCANIVSYFMATYGCRYLITQQE